MMENEEIIGHIEQMFVSTNNKIDELIDVTLQHNDYLKSIKAEIEVIKTRLLELEPCTDKDTTEELIDTYTSDRDSED